MNGMVWEKCIGLGFSIISTSWKMKNSGSQSGTISLVDFIYFVSSFGIGFSSVFKPTNSWHQSHQVSIFFPFVINMVVVGLVFSWFYNPSYGLLGRS